MRDRVRSPARFTAVTLVPALLVGIGMVPAGAAAQDPEPPSGPGVPAAVGDTLRPILLEPILVEVLRSSIPPARIPFSLAVRASDAAKPGLALDEALRAIPGLHVENRYNDALGERISIRGFGARASFGVRGVGVFIDGVPATLPDGQTTLTALDPTLALRAEVMRGPASSIFGNAAGGVLLLESGLPDPGEAAADLAVGEHGHRRIGAGGGADVGQGRVSGWLTRSEYGGFREFSGSERLHLTLGADMPLASGRLRLTAAAVTYDARNPGSLDADQRRTDPTAANGFNVAQRTGEDADHVQVGLVWKGEGGASTWEIAGWALLRDVENPIPPVIIGLDRRAGGGRVLWRHDGALLPGSILTMGIEAGVQADDRINHENDGGIPGTLVLDQDERVVGAAAFGQLLLPLHGRFDFLAGMRWDRTRFRVDDGLIGPDEPDDSGERTMDAVSPAVGVTAKVAPTLQLYANAATSFETPTTTELANRPEGAGGFNEALEPQRTLSVEGGARWLPSDSWAVRAAIYRARVKDLLVPFQVPEAPAREFFRNAGRAVHQGAEVLFEGSVHERLDARLAWSWTDARFRSFRVGGEVFDGNRVPGVPPHRIEAGATLSPTAGLDVALDARWRSRMAVDDANEGHSPSWWVMDLRVLGGPWDWQGAEVRPWASVQNLADRPWDASVVVNAFGGRYFEPGPGRTFGGGFRVTFR